MDTADSPTKTQAGEDENYILLCQAHDQFVNAEFDQCLELLQELETRGESSCPVLRHNRAVVTYHRSGCTQHAVLLKELEELTTDADAPGEGGLSLKQGAAGATVARYNRAVIYYHRHMYGTALEKLSPLVSRLEALEKSMSALVATLQLQLLLATNQLNRAEAFLEYLQFQLNLVGTAPTNNPTAEEAANASASSPPNNAVVAAPGGGSSAEGSPSVVGGSLQLLQWLTLVLNRKPLAITEDGSPEYAALKAQQYYIMKDFQMAAKQLMRINNECTQAGTVTPQLSTCIANNMGVIHLRVRHYAIAAEFFQNALNFDQQLARNLRKSSLQTMTSARSSEILYNLGVAMLHLRRPKEAFQCFLVPVKQFHSNPRLWLRMAEACIMEHEAKLAEEERQVQPGAASPSPSKPYVPQSAGVPEPTLEFAALCLRSALSLTLSHKASFHMTPIPPDDAEAPDPKDTTQDSWRQPQDNNFCNPSKPVSLESMDNMLAAIYAAHSFVSLRLDDHVTALEMAEELLACERLSDAHKLLGHMYAGEALMLMDKAAEARDHLDPTFVGTLNAFDLETRDWQLKSLDAAQNVMRYNLAVAMVLQKDLPQARTLLASLNHSLVGSKAMALRRFIDLMMAIITNPGTAPS
ncbi:hypothetical protein KR009_002584 [Drosophila setifemur]|nr:hypothetical protein KR009_002584 [Drosophila setifemur]